MLLSHHVWFYILLTMRRTSDSQMVVVQLHRPRLLPNFLPAREMIGWEVEEVDRSRKIALQKARQHLFQQDL